MHPILNISLMAAKKAGNVMLRSFERLDTINASSKGLHDFVTDVDRKAEQEIIAVIQKAYPDHQIIAEESGTLQGREDCIWHIDPLDGTHNYMRGVPHFCVSIGFQFKGKLEHAVVYDPIRREIFSASRGEGARLNDRKIRVSALSKLEKALVGTGFPVRNPTSLSAYLPVFNQLMPSISNIRCAGSAALDLAYVAAARLDAYAEVNLRSWDMAAGVLLVQEAGGLVCDWQGKENYMKNGTVVAASPKILGELVSVVSKSTFPVF
jgi:myo-inositol-1(or 4)-monophosphatase